jgi:hypothetical protein
MNVICLEDAAFYELLDQVVERIKYRHNITEDKWISGEEAMRKLCISSRTTLRKLLDEGTVGYSLPDRKIILFKFWFY